MDEEIRKGEKKWQSQIKEMSKFKVKRWLKTDKTLKVKPQLHVYSDASKYGYGFVAYRRTEWEGEVDVKYLFSKSRVIPKESSKTRHFNAIPRFELQAGTSAVEFKQVFLEEAGEEYGEVFIWCDSTCVINQVKDEKTRFDTFVANRLSRIRADSDPAEWHYVNTKDNPADYTSRGLEAKDTESWRKFHEGPECLWKRQEDWKIEKVPEITKAQMGAVVVETSEKTKKKPWIVQVTERHGEWIKKKRIIARVMEGVERWKGKRKGKSREETTREKRLERAEVLIIKGVQEMYFGKEGKRLRERGIREPNGREEVTEKDSKLRKLNIFLDKEEVIRAGTRLINTETLDFGMKCPIILPKEDEIVDSIIRHTHRALLHAGTEQVRNTLRETFHIVSDGTQVKRVINKCVDCQKRFKPVMEQKMAALPAVRIEAGEPFSASGADVFGPYDTKQGRAKKKKWVVMFTCLKTRAIHLEVVETMSTSSFLNALVRFTSRRPGVRQIYSDCGTNFKGAEAELKRAVEGWNSTRKGEERIKGLEWTFNPPLAHHRGGVWERMIKSTKKHLVTVIGKETIESDVLSTVLTQIEGIVNYRPITHVSADPRDVGALTPMQILCPGVTITASANILPPGPVVLILGN